jgi:hypothetical protein
MNYPRLNIIVRQNGREQHYRYWLTEIPLDKLDPKDLRNWKAIFQWKNPVTEEIQNSAYAFIDHSDDDDPNSYEDR